MSQEKPPLDPHPLSEYVAWAGGRNREPLLGVLKEKLPKDPGNVLELASGSGMHINYFAPHFEHLHFHPSDKDSEVFDNIKKLSSDHGNDNIADPVHLDLTNPILKRGLISTRQNHLRPCSASISFRWHLFQLQTA